MINKLVACRSPMASPGISHLPTLSPSAPTGATTSSPMKKTHQRSKSDATAAIVASSRIMEVNFPYGFWRSIRGER